MLERAPNWECEARRLALGAITGRRTGRREGAPDLETPPPPARDAVIDADSEPRLPARTSRGEDEDSQR